MADPTPKNALQILPESYQCTGTVDLFKQKGLALGLNLAGIVLFVIVYLPLFLLVSGLRGQQTGFVFEINTIGQIILILFWGLIFMTVLIILHEAAHGLFFWIYTRQMPKFAYKLTYAYAAAPGWYIRRNAYRVVATAPIFMLSGIGLILCLFIPLSWLMPVVLFISINIASAIGDLYVYMRLLHLPENAYIVDEGDRMSFFTEVFPDTEMV
jgi:hypothetical protein